MIQRIQSIYLFSASVFSGILIFVFYLWIDKNSEQYAFDLLKFDSIIEKLVPIFFLGSSVLSLITIFLFKNRKLQFVLGRINIFINFLLLGLLLYLLLTLSGEYYVSEKGIGMFIPIPVILLVFFANKAIMNDEYLVKSADRLR